MILHMMVEKLVDDGYLDVTWKEADIDDIDLTSMADDFYGDSWLLTIYHDNYVAHLGFSDDDFENFIRGRDYSVDIDFKQILQAQRVDE